MALTQISTAGVKDDAVTSGKIPANAVGSSELADNAVDTAAIVNNAVTTAKISDDNVTFEKIENITANQVLGRVASGTGEIQALSGAHVRSIINVADGANQTTINNNADNRVITGSGTANTLEGEANLTWNATTLKVQAATPAIEISGTNSNGGNSSLHFNANANHWVLEADNFTQQNAFAIKSGTTASSTPRLTISSDGRVGIGKTPSSTFDIETGSNANGFNLNCIGTPANYFFNVRDDNVSKFFIKNDGKIGIGTDTPDSILHCAFDSGSTAPTSGTTPKGIGQSFGGTNGHNAGVWFSADFGGDQGIAGIAGTRVNQYQTDLRFYTNSTGSARAFSERMRLNSDGDLLVGRPASIDTSEVFGIQGPSGDHCTFGMTTNGTTNNGIISFNDTDANFRGQIRYHHSSDSMQFWTNGANERMRIGSDGSVYIGTTSGGNTGAYFQNDNNSRKTLNIGSSSSATQNQIIFRNSNDRVGTIQTSGSSTSYNTTFSDIASKKNFENWTENVLSLFKNINPQKFNFKVEDDSASKSKGFIAQEMVDKFPEAYVKQEDEMYMFNPSGMVVYLMKAVQELEAEVAALKAAYKAELIANKSA